MKTATHERHVIATVGELNEMIRKLNGMGTNVIPTTLSTFDPTQAVARWRRQTKAYQEGPENAADNAKNRV